MDDLALLVIIFLIGSGICYIIGLTLWWVVLFVGAAIFLFVVYFTDGQYLERIGIANNDIGKLKSQVLSQDEISKLMASANYRSYLPK